MTFKHCIRCDKDVTHNPVHTCTPSAKYCAGMEEGKQLTSEWVSVSDRLPQKFVPVLVFVSNKIIVGEYYGEENGGWANHLALEPTTHWMELPSVDSINNRENIGLGQE